MVQLLSEPEWHANENIALRLNELIAAHNLAVEKLDALARQVWRMDAENDAEDDAFDMDWDYYHPPSCPECGMTHEVVRPGKTQPRCRCDELATLRVENERLDAELRMAESDLAKQYVQMGAMDAEINRLHTKNAELCRACTGALHHIEGTASTFSERERTPVLWLLRTALEQGNERRKDTPDHEKVHPGSSEDG